VLALPIPGVLVFPKLKDMITAYFTIFANVNIKTNFLFAAAKAERRRKPPRTKDVIFKFSLESYSEKIQ
jgi:hypothetical protein